MVRTHNVKYEWIESNRIIDNVRHRAGHDRACSQVEPTEDEAGYERTGYLGDPPCRMYSSEDHGGYDDSERAVCHVDEAFHHDAAKKNLFYNRTEK